MRWDIFCRVIDNHGDIGVCWRLARGLALHGQQVRLWVDEPAALAWMAPQGAAGVVVRHWSAQGEGGDAGASDSSAGDSLSTASTASAPSAADPGDVVVEAFGCDPPPAFVARMAAKAPAPVWLNLEYLSAEPYVARSHGLPSPQWTGPGAGLVKWFFYPGFSRDTGGLLHGDLAQVAQDEARTTAPTAAASATGHPPTRQALLFCYDNPALPGLLQALAAQGPTLLRVPPGPAQAAVARTTLPAGLQWQPQPLLTQPQFDALLAGCGLNLVRGEDSFVRAQLASDSPWLWQAYPQRDGAHAVKLEAFLEMYLNEAPAQLAGPLGQAFRAFNGLAPWPQPWPPATAWAAHQARWRRMQLAQTDLLSRLLAFVEDKVHATAHKG